MKFRLKLVFLIMFVLAILFVCLIPIITTWLEVPRNGGHSDGYTIMDFHVLAAGVWELAHDPCETLPKEAKALSEHVKRNLDSFRPLFRRNLFDPNTGLITDRWGTSINLVTKTLQEYTFISAGPNRVHENGKGDDIVFTFDALDPQKKPEIIIGGKTIKAK